MSLEDSMTPEDKLVLYAVLQDIADELRRIEREDREEQKAQRNKAKDTKIEGAGTQAPTPKPPEFPGISDKVTASIRTFLAIIRPDYTLLSLLDRSQDGKRAWLAFLARKFHDGMV